MKNEKNQTILEKDISRRSLLRFGGLGMAVAATAGIAVGCKNRSSVSGVIDDSPLPYKSLDPEAAALLAHKGYYDGECSYAAYYAIMTLLRETVGGPYNQIPTRTMRFGGAGVAGWGTLCGALNGSCAAISTVVPNADISKVTNELLFWYSNAVLPTDESNKLGAEGKFTKTTIDYPKVKLYQSTSHSPLCHASLSQWCVGANIEKTDPKRLERCARVSADTARKAVQLLNAYFDGSFKPVATIDESSAACLSCHEPYTGQVKMTCSSCHEPHPDKK